ncbi:MAG: glycosyltransferase family 2 protein [Mucilaginibacter sp.]
MEVPKMKVSIITVVYNNEALIRQCIESVLAQDYKDIEYIVVDGASTDGTLAIINEYRQQISTLISEKDNGLYDAMNKGIIAATGDVVGILNSDDFFYDNDVLSKISLAFSDPLIDATISDIVFLKKNSTDKVARKYSSENWNPAKFAWGYMPPHPSFFVKRSLLNKFGLYKTDYKIAADYELLIRYFLVNKINWKYLPMITTKMSLGGASTKGFKSLLIINKEIAKACKENNVFSNYAMIYSKYLFKPFEFIST